MKPFFWIFFLLFSFRMFSQDNGELKTIQAHRIEREQILLDGRLDEPFWAEIQGVSSFLMQEPIKGRQPTERTVVKIAFDENNLYIAAMLYDQDPSGVKSFQMRRDAELETDDRFRWILDTYLDGRNAYFFEINPRGLISDGLLSVGQGTTLSKNWASTAGFVIPLRPDPTYFSFITIIGLIMKIDLKRPRIRVF